MSTLCVYKILQVFEDETGHEGLSRTGVFTVEGGAKVFCRNCHFVTELLDVNAEAHISADGKGLKGGEGAGTGRGGSSYGGRGGMGNVASRE